MNCTEYDNLKRSELIKACKEKNMSGCTAKGSTAENLRKRLCGLDQPPPMSRQSSSSSTASSFSSKKGGSRIEAELEQAREKRQLQATSSRENMRYAKRLNEMEDDLATMLRATISKDRRTSIPNIIKRNSRDLHATSITHTEFDGGYAARKIKGKWRRLETKHFYTHATKFDPDVRNGMGVLTKMVVPSFMPSSEYRIRFIDLISRVFNLLCMVVYDKYEVNYQIMLKGGNVFRIMMRSFSDDLRRGAARDIEEFTHDITEMTDFDFELFPVYFDDDGDLRGRTEAELEEYRKRVEATETTVQMLSYMATMRMRDFIVDNLSFIMPGLLHLRDQAPNIGNYEASFVSELQRHFDNLPDGEYYSGIKLLTVTYAHEYLDAFDDEGRRLKTEEFSTPKPRDRLYRKDFIIDHRGPNRQHIYNARYFFKAEHEGIFRRHLLPKYSERSMRNKVRRAMYCTHSREIDSGHDRRFQLNRIKITLLIAYEKDGESRIDALPAEIFDLSHAFILTKKGLPSTQADEKMLHGMSFFRNYSLHSPAVTTNIVSYTPLGLLADAEFGVFKETQFAPWEDFKYKKRLRRMLWMTILDLLGGDGTYASHIELLKDLRRGMQKQDMSLRLMKTNKMSTADMDSEGAYAIMTRCLQGMIERHQQKSPKKVKEALDTGISVIRRALHILTKNRTGTMSPSYALDDQMTQKVLYTEY